MDNLVNVSTKAAPAAIGPYSQAVICGNLLFTSGQIALDPIDGALVEGGIEAQTHRICANLRAVLEAAGCGFDSVVKTTCFLADMNDFVVFNAIYGQYFINKPARSCVAAKALPKGALAEIEVLAAL